MYTISKNLFDRDVIIRDADLADIPTDERNIDYCAYVEWATANNQPVVPATILKPVPLKVLEQIL